VQNGGEIRLRLTIHYDGSGFHGWQIQPDVRTVQGEIEDAARRLTGKRRPVMGSGRTDTGVHATGQVASLTVPSRWSASSFRKAMNAVLPDDIWLRSVDRVGPDFHPRYDAVARTYGYRVGLSEEAVSPFVRRWCWPLRAELDVDLLSRAAVVIRGDHSFAAFAKSGQPERGDRCEVREAFWEPWETLGVRFQITADRYLHHMVRYLVGTMVDVARGRRPFDDLGALLEGGSGELETSPPAPPEGLFLTSVEYPPEGDARAADSEDHEAGRRAPPPETP
jgi:tRNA pseudouridine38-40 synthase